MIKKFSIKSQGGQVIIILLLLMLVGLSIILAYTQRSVSDVTTSTQSEQSTRAFSAAEAGIAKALSSPLPAGTTIPFSNDSKAQITGSGLLPYAGSGVAIEYPKIGRETTAHFWLVDPSVAGAPVAYYNPSPSRFDLYYGNDATTDLPAVEVSVVMFANNAFSSNVYYYDSNSSRSGAGPGRNGFTQTTLCGGGGQTVSSSILGSNRKFYCKQPVPSTTTEILKPGTALPCTSANSCTLILARIRFLYINENHSLAIAPTSGNNLPPQVQIYNATGTSGQSQKRLQAFRVKDVVLPWFDFAIFSTNEIVK